MGKVRVLHICNQLDIGGTEKALQIFCKYLDKARFEVFACGRLRGGSRVAELEKLGIPVFVQPPDVTQLVRERDIDICHVHRGGDYEPGSLPEKHKGRPRIVETNVFHAVDTGQDEWIDGHLFVSRYSLEQYVLRHGRRLGVLYEAVYNPIDFEEFPPRRKAFDCTIGRCSRPDDQKWHDVCLDSLPKILRKVPQTRCVIQGATDRVEARLYELGLHGRVVLLDPSIDVSGFYRQVDVFIHGARIGETFGSVIAEAMANGIPVVTLSTPQRGKANAQAELVEHNVTGFVCRWRWQYAGAVVELLQNRALRERFAKSGYEKARELFEASRVTRQLERVYLDLME
ncbi:MAG: glycosyltransferase family 4 protein [bacterium]